MPRRTKRLRRNPTVEEVEQEILETEATEADVRRAVNFIESFRYTTTAVFALSQALEEMEFDQGADVLSAAVRKLAKLEAETV